MPPDTEHTPPQPPAAQPYQPFPPQDRPQSAAPQPGMLPPPTLQQYSSLDRYGHYTGQQARRKRSPLRAAIGILVTVMLLAGLSFGAWAAYSAFSLSPQKRFDIAIQKRLDSGVIQRDTTIEQTAGGNAINLVSSSVSDFSDPTNPKTKGKFTVQVKGGPNSTGGRADVDFVMPNKADTYVRYSSLPTTGTTVPQKVVDQWVKLDISLAALSFDPYFIAAGLNTPQGEVITGRFSANLRQDIINRINNDKIYTITAAAGERLDNRDTLKYSVKLNRQKLVELNDYVAKQLQLSDPNASSRLEVSQFTAWVDTSTNELVQLRFEPKGRKTTVSYSSPKATSDFKAPVDFVNGSTLFE